MDSIDYRMDVQAALDFHDGRTCQVEKGVPAQVREAIASLGHEVRPAVNPHGGGQAIWMTEGVG